MTSLQIAEIRKRDGRVVPFKQETITDAIVKAGKATGQFNESEAAKISDKVVATLKKTYADITGLITVENIQDVVELTLMRSGYETTAKSYIVYRNEHAKIRANRKNISPEVKTLVDKSKKYFRNSLGEFIYYRTYSRWKEEEGRRETWIETVDRYIDFMKENVGNKLKEEEYQEVREHILKQEAMPSMRLLQFAGKPARATNVCAYNCSYIAPESFRDFAEIMYISMCGTGVGYSVESQNIAKLPQILPQVGKKLPVFVIPDSKEGWTDALIKGMEAWATGKDIDFDFSKIRPLGARLKTMGGKASGPEPLNRLLKFTRETMLKKQGKRLTNLDAHDIICMIGECVVAGGVRRSAMISLSDLDDQDLRDAKKGQFWSTAPQRSMANNSAIYTNKPTNEEFLDEWLSLIKSRSGERGIFNRGSLAKSLPERRLKYFATRGFLDPSGQVVIGSIGTNPCGEIILQSKQFCNLSEVVARAEDTVETLLSKIKIATILGTYQASLTNFPYLSKEWKKNCEDERLLGVSITGQWDCPEVRRPEVLRRLKEEAIKVNREYSKQLGINPSTCITCVKPSGNLSQTVDCSSGMHPRHSPYYIRRVRIASTDSLFKMLKDQKIPYHPEVGQSFEDATTLVIDFPVKSPAKTTVFKDTMSAIEQLEHWKKVKINYTEHNPSVTISVGDDEWVEVANWLYANWDMLGGLSFLPRNEYVYHLAPYEEITAKEYEDLVKKWKNVDFAMIMAYEKHDETDRKQELACVSGTCEVDLVVAPSNSSNSSDSSQTTEV